MSLVKKKYFLPENEKWKFHYSKCAIAIKDADINKIHGKIKTVLYPQIDGYVNIVIENWKYYSLLKISSSLLWGIIMVSLLLIIDTSL